MRLALKKYSWRYLMILPGILYYIIFHYIPMGGIIIAFKDYQPWLGFFDSPWTSNYGLNHFITFFKSGMASKLIWNTFYISVMKLLFKFPAQILFALLLADLTSKVFKRVIQTVSYFPYFLSWMAVIGLIGDVLSPSYGVVNKVIEAFGGEAIFFFQELNWYVPIVVISALWKYLGWGSIIYFAAIMGIDQQLYEAAVVDGAGKIKQIIHVTIPGIYPIMTIMLILNIGEVMIVDFEQLIALYRFLPFFNAKLQVINTYVFQSGLLSGQFSPATAIGLFTSVISLILIVGSNWFAKKVGQDGLW